MLATVVARDRDRRCLVSRLVLEAMAGAPDQHPDQLRVSRSLAVDHDDVL